MSTDRIAKSGDNILRARGLILTDDQGRERIRMCVDQINSEADTPRLEFLDGAGRVRLVLAISTRDELPFARFFDIHGKTVLYIGESWCDGHPSGGLVGFDLDDSTGLPDRDVVKSDSRSELERRRLQPPPSVLDTDVVTALTDLARAGNEEEFRWLARSQGVQPDELDELWAGTVRRTRRRRGGRRSQAVA